MRGLVTCFSRATFRLQQILLSSSKRTMDNRNSSHVARSSDDKPAEEEEKQDYENAVLKLHTLVSNAEAIALNRANREARRMTHVADIQRFILQSGISEEDLSKLSMIHVSGTKGKGSTCAFCERILCSKGYKTGLFTSPHLVEVRERIRINGRPVSKELYAHHFWKVYNKLKALQEDKKEKLPAYFAFNMILSLHIFVAEGVDVGIMEVGIGGQYDSTNFIRRPTVCGVTSLGFDHTSVLGNTIEEIAWNKAGIFKSGCPAIVATQPPAAMKVILDRAKERQSALYVATPIESEVLERENINLGISGNKQKLNAGLAVQLACMWESRHSKDVMNPMACNVSEITSVEEIPRLEAKQLDSPVARGLSSCVWPGRAQTVKRPGVTYFLDGAHTKESIQVCSQWFKDAAEEESRTIQGKVARVLIFNVTGERKPKPLLEPLKECKFDAAGFSTNIVSTIDSYNRPDQVHPVFTVEAILEKAEANRACWDNLSSLSSSSSSSSSPRKPKQRKIHNNPDGTTPNGSIKSHIINSSGDSSNHSSPSPINVNHETLKSGHFENNNNTSATSTVCNSVRKSLESPVISDNHSICNNQQCTDGKRDFKFVCEENAQSVSHSFPCVLQALNWASQNKDATVMVKDPKTHLPSAPASLQAADHIQVLVTGSLHLVGAVLGVLTPDMND